MLSCYHRKMGRLSAGEVRMSGKRVFYLLIVALFVISCQGRETIDPAKLRGGETRPTLSPVYFTGKAGRAYEIAKEIPEILDSLYCFCECKENFGHKSLLTCYVDQHALHCDICQDEALVAYDLYKEGKDVVSIRRAVDRRFSR